MCIVLSSVFSRCASHLCAEQAPPCLSLLLPDELVLAHHTSDAHWILCWQVSHAAQSHCFETDWQVHLLQQAHSFDCLLSCGIFAHMLHASTDAHACSFWQVHLHLNKLFSRLVHNLFGCLFVLSCLYACLQDQACQVPLSPIDHHLSVLCIHKCTSFELCVQMPPLGPPGGRSSATSLSSTSFVAVAMGSCSRLQAVLLPCHAFKSSFLVVGVRHPPHLWYVY